MGPNGYCLWDGDGDVADIHLGGFPIFVFPILAPLKFLMNMMLSFLGGLLLIVMFIAFLPVPEQVRYESLSNDAIRIKEIHERIVANPKPIDVAFIGTSHTWNGVSDSEIESLLSTAGTSVAVANLASSWPGRDINLFLIKQLLRHKNPRLIILEIQEHEYRGGHGVLPYVANLSDMFCCRFFLDPHFPRNFLSYLKRQTLNSLTLILRGGSELVGADPADFGWMPLTRTGRPFHPALSSNTPSITRVKELGYVATSAYGLDVVRRIVRLARERRVDVAFLYLPEFAYANRPPVVSIRYYTELGPVLRIPATISKDPTMWFDKAHLNLDGSKLLAFKLAADVQTLLNLGKPNDIWN